jgi:aminoglycoside 6'-N-acetyltransferase
MTSDGATKQAETWDPAAIGFRRLREEDVALLHEWLQTPHVRRWWQPESEWSEQDLMAKYLPMIAGNSPTAPYVISYEGVPIGYIQTYRAAAYPEWAAIVAPDEEAAGVDLFIGEANYVRRGLGVHVLRRFLRDVVFVAPEIVSCVLDAESTNTIAIRAYEKVGFRQLKTEQFPDQEVPSLILRIAREDLDA